jgi:ABC-type branched-subunit amino acid transport system ATPase component/ABC-type branched-subunit amino acid transport system permease subunit
MNRYAIYLALIIVGVLSPFFSIPGWSVSGATVAAISAIALIGLNLIFGMTGMLAFGQAAFVALPGYMAGVLEQLGVPLVAALVVGFMGTIIVARVAAEVFVRLPGIFLAVGTLGFSLIVEGLARAFPEWTGGASGLVVSIGRGIGPNSWYVISVIALSVSLAVYASLVRATHWRRLRSISHDELAAEVAGIPVVRHKIRIFTIGCAFSAASGVILLCYVGVLTPESAGLDRSLQQIAALLLGGARTLFGPVLGAAFFQWLFFAAGTAGNFELLIYGAAFMGTILFAPLGLAGLAKSNRGKFKNANSDAPAGSPVRSQIPINIEIPASPRQGICLSIKELRKSFGGVRALDGVTFDAYFGEVFALVGPNGAGKTTLFNIISGIEEPTGGQILLLNNELKDLTIHQRATLIGRSFQVPRLVPELTSTENIMVRLDQIFPNLREAERRAVALAQLEVFNLLSLAQQPVRTLSVGQHKLVDLARAAVGNPSLVLLDEPAVGLTMDELTHLADLIRRLRAQQSAVIIVEHNIDFVSAVADQGVVLDSGKKIALGKIKDILADARVRDAYFGAIT